MRGVPKHNEIMNTVYPGNTPTPSRKGNTALLVVVIIAGFLIGFAGVFITYDSKGGDDSVEDVAVDRNFKGSIGQYQITMTLNSKSLDGTYYYDVRPNSVFTLTCTSVSKQGDGSREVVIEERTDQGTQSGTFRGTVDKQCSVFSGYFTNNQNGKVFKFDVSQQ